MGCASSREAFADSAPPSELSTVFFEKYALGVKLGRGASAQVRIATKLTPGNHDGDVAVKIIDLRDVEEPDRKNHKLVKAFNKEHAMWESASNHNNVVRLHDVFFDEAFCYFVMERCTSSLFAHLESIPELNERSIRSLLVQILVGLSHVHSVGVVHRDVKPDNILMGGERGTTVKLCDFGLSAFLPKEGRVKGVSGTAPFMCPEMIMQDYYDGSADVWSVGVLTYCLLFGDFPYVPKVKSTGAMKQAVVSGTPPTFEPVAPCQGQVRSNSVVAFVHTLLERAPDQRPSASATLKMPFIVAEAQNDDLPSLRPMIYAAKKVGAFELRDPTKEVDIDPLLNKKQQEKHGFALPDQILCANSVLGKNSSPCEMPNSSQAAKSCNSFNSNMWDNSSSFSTTASGNSGLQGLPSPSGSFSPFPTCMDSGGSQFDSTSKASAVSAIMTTTV